MFAARTSAGPRASRRSVTGSSDVQRSTRSFRLRMTSVTSSFTPLMTSNSWSASSKRTCVTAAPGIDDRSVRRRLLPSVWPKPGSSGEIVKLWTLPSASPASISGRWIMSMAASLAGEEGLLRVELDDELLAHGNVDLLAQRQIAHRRLELARVHIEPLRSDAIERVDVVADHDHLLRLRRQRNDVVLSQQVRGNRHPLAVDVHVAVPHELARLVAARRERGAEHHVVEAQFEQAEQVFTGDAGLLVRLVVRELELLFEQAVDATRLLLLAQ